LADVVAVIKAQHRRIDTLLDQAQQEGADVDSLVQQVADLLLPHSEAEEDFVYPTIRAKASDAASDVKDGVAEHHHIEDMLRSLLAQKSGDPGYDGTLAAFTAELRHHVEEEEQELLPLLEEKASRDELAQMGQRFEQVTTGGSTGGASGDEPTRDELYQKAKEQDVPGRSSMTKDELKDAVD
jgi:hemerythrin superfamily protein